MCRKLSRIRSIPSRRRSPRMSPAPGTHRTMPSTSQGIAAQGAGDGVGWTTCENQPGYTAYTVLTDHTHDTVTARTSSYLKRSPRIQQHRSSRARCSATLTLDFALRAHISLTHSVRITAQAQTLARLSPPTLPLGVTSSLTTTALGLQARTPSKSRTSVLSNLRRCSEAHPYSAARWRTRWGRAPSVAMSQCGRSS